jgi:hypothetical protein
MRHNIPILCSYIVRNLYFIILIYILNFLYTMIITIRCNAVLSYVFILKETYISIPFRSSTYLHFLFSITIVLPTIILFAIVTSNANTILIGNTFQRLRHKWADNKQQYYLLGGGGVHAVA